MEPEFRGFSCMIFTPAGLFPMRVWARCQDDAEHVAALTVAANTGQAFAVYRPEEEDVDGDR
jgi:hypothetical protein